MTEMSASFDAFALKPFTKALTCIAKYGDDLTIHATPDALSFSTTNSSKYSVKSFELPELEGGDIEEIPNLKGELLVKSLLSILRHRTVEKTIERCEMSIVEGHPLDNNDTKDSQYDSVESKLIIRMFCKHGVVKTHRLVLSVPTSLMTPGAPDEMNESSLTIGARPVKDIIEHFPVSRSSKSDPQLMWLFSESEVLVKSLESPLDSKGKLQLSTELSISAEEFNVYNLYATPTTIVFHLREFNATIAFAESTALSMDLRFTDPTEPLFIDVEGDNFNFLFVISTSQVPGMQTPRSQTVLNHRKRTRDDTPAQNPRFKKPMKVVHLTETPSRASPRIASAVPRGVSERPGASAGSPLPASPEPKPDSQDAMFDQASFPPAAYPAHLSSAPDEPLFLPGTQASVSYLNTSVDIEIEEEEEAIMAPSQSRISPDDKEFQPLFDD